MNSNDNKKSPTSYARFWMSWNRLPHVDEEAEKAALVMSFTDGRTDSLREMTVSEYDSLCQSLEERTGVRKQYLDELRRLRSICLHLMQELGIDTSKWHFVDAFTLSPRICGRHFSNLRPDELKVLEKKLRAIARRGGLRQREPPQPVFRGNTVSLSIPADPKGEC